IVVSPWGGTQSEDVEQSLCQNDGDTLISPLSVIEAPLPAPKPVVISLLEGGEEPWIPDVRSPEAVPGDRSPGGARITNCREDAQNSGAAERQHSSVSVRETRRDVRSGPEQGEHFKKPLGKHPGKRARNHLGFSSGQKEPEDPRRKLEKKCQKKKQKHCPECGKSFRSSSEFVNHRCVNSQERLHECSDCGRSFEWRSNLTRHESIHMEERPYECLECGKSFRISS
ncbi:hypothetical protein CIB84_015850, partial [Bambusicola thoracicus]